MRMRPITRQSRIKHPLPDWGSVGELPEIRRLFRAWVAAGRPKTTVETVGENLMKLQAKIQVWYLRAERVRLVDAKAADSMEREIQRCQQFIGDTLAQLRRGV